MNDADSTFFADTTFSDYPVERELGDRERLDWLRLIRSEKVGPITFFQLLERFGNAAAALDALPGLARRGGRTKPLRLCSRHDAAGELEALGKAGARLVCLPEPGYPRLLRHIADPPPVLAVKGHSHLTDRPCVAIVGARNASAVGIRFTGQLAADLGRRDLVVASGMARGIDTAAHQGALATGTIAVLGGGVDVIYPSENRRLYENLTETGMIVAETPVGTQPLPRHFPRRNRLISGMSYGVIVVEAAPRSGSLITARMALEQGREVLAVPGSPLDPRARGTNGLIRNGARLCEGADDIVEAISPMLQKPLAEGRRQGLGGGPAADVPDDEWTEARRLVVEKLGPTPVEVDELLRQTQLTPAVLLTILLELELADRLARHPGNKVSAG